MSSEPHPDYRVEVLRKAGFPDAAAVLAALPSSAIPAPPTQEPEAERQPARQPISPEADLNSTDVKRALGQNMLDILRNPGGQSVTIRDGDQR